MDDKQETQKNGRNKMTKEVRNRKQGCGSGNLVCKKVGCNNSQKWLLVAVGRNKSLLLLLLPTATHYPACHQCNQYILSEKSVMA